MLVCRLETPLSEVVGLLCNLSSTKKNVYRLNSEAVAKKPLTLLSLTPQGNLILSLTR